MPCVNKMEFPITTNKQVEIERTSEDIPENYRIVWGNPLTNEKDGELLCNYPKVNGISFATEYMELSQYNREMTITENGNILIDKGD